MGASSIPHEQPEEQLLALSTTPRQLSGMFLTNSVTQLQQSAPGILAAVELAIMMGVFGLWDYLRKFCTGPTAVGMWLGGVYGALWALKYALLQPKNNSEYVGHKLIAQQPSMGEYVGFLLFVGLGKSAMYVKNAAQREISRKSRKNRKGMYLGALRWGGYGVLILVGMWAVKYVMLCESGQNGSRWSEFFGFVNGFLTVAGAVLDAIAVVGGFVSLFRR